MARLDVKRKPRRKSGVKRGKSGPRVKRPERGNQFVGAYYPWDEWFSKAARRTVRLTRGVDYSCQDHGMASQVRTRAGKRGVSASVLIGEGYLEFRTRPRSAGGYKRGRKADG